MLSRMQTLKRKLSMLKDEDADIQRATGRRYTHIQELQGIPTLVDVKYDQWSRVRLDRLLVDYMLRQGYTESAQQLSAEKNIEDLVDVDAFVQCRRIEKSLQDGEVREALDWCRANTKDLKKMNSTLELQLRLQQYIELLRTRDSSKMKEAIAHSRKFIAPSGDRTLIEQTAGLLVFTPEATVQPYHSLYSAARWAELASNFVQTYYKLFALPPQPLLDFALSSGLSVLKTYSCHSDYPSTTSNATTASATVCPICSTELHELSKNVPYAHHDHSHVEHDPVVLPNGRVYGRERLVRWNEKVGTSEGKVRDPMDIDQEWLWDDVRKIYIS